MFFSSDHYSIEYLFACILVNMCQIFLGQLSRSEGTGSHGMQIFISLNIAVLLLWVAVPIYILKSSCFSTPLTVLGIIRCLIISHSDAVIWCLIVDSIYMSLMLGKMTTFSYILSALGVFWELSIHIFAHVSSFSY